MAMWTFTDLRLALFFLVRKGKLIAYAWHYTKARALKHLEKIAEFHNLEGEIKESEKLENWLKEAIDKTVFKERKFSLPDIEYKNRLVYENILKIPKGKTSTYAKIAKISNVSFSQFLITLMRNPFQILIPCHRLLTNKGTLLGFYPLGKGVKRKLLEIEGFSSEKNL